MRSPSESPASALDPDEHEDGEDGFADSVGLPETPRDAGAGPATQAFLPRPLRELFGADRGRLAMLVGGTLVDRKSVV